MSSRPVAILAVGIALALCGCQGNAPNRPDPNAYLLTFLPESVAMETGNTSEVSVFATQTSTTGVKDTTDQTGVDNTTDTDNIIIRSIEWAVDNGRIASLSQSLLTPDGYAKVSITCQTAGTTTVLVAVTLDSEQRLTKSLPLTCAPAGSASH
jgi:hypothetical protein